MVYTTVHDFTRIEVRAPKVLWPEIVYDHVRMYALRGRRSFEKDGLFIESPLIVVSFA
jgi:hypothetical protein